MVSIPLLGGMAANAQAEFVESVPVNLEPVAVDNKIAAGQFRAPAGLIPYWTGPGEDRGGINWNGRQFRVMGTSLVEVGGVDAALARARSVWNGRAERYEYEPTPMEPWQAGLL